MNEQKCDMKKCRGTPAISYKGMRICDECWLKVKDVTDERLHQMIGEAKRVEQKPNDK